MGQGPQHVLRPFSFSERRDAKLASTNDEVASAPLQRLLGVNRVTLNDLAKRGIVVRGRRGYALEASVGGDCHHLREMAAGRGGEANINGERIGEIKKRLAASSRRARVEGVTPHVLRHTAASWLMQSGMNTEKAARFLAMSKKMLEDVYGHLHLDFHKEAADTIGRRPGVSRMGR